MGEPRLKRKKQAKLKRSAIYDPDKKWDKPSGYYSATGEDGIVLACLAICHQFQKQYSGMQLLRKKVKIVVDRQTHNINYVNDIIYSYLIRLRDAFTDNLPSYILEKKRKLLAENKSMVWTPDRDIKYIILDALSCDYIGLERKDEVVSIIFDNNS